jgi:hypothetical protein
MVSYAKFHTGLYESFYALGRDTQLSRYRGGAYKDSIQFGKYMVEFTEDDSDSQLIIWNPDRPCLNASIDRSDKVAVLNTANYDPRCTIDGNMARGEGTREMIRFFLKLLKEKGSESVELSDKSTVICNGIKIRLGLMYFFKFGETWYEKYFGFKPTEKYRSKYEAVKQKRYLVGDLSNKPCDYFTDDIIDNLVNKVGFGFFYNISWKKVL